LFAVYGCGRKTRRAVDLVHTNNCRALAVAVGVAVQGPGDTNQAGEDCRNIARNAGLLAGLPVSVGGITINRLCGSGAAAVLDASRAIKIAKRKTQKAGVETELYVRDATNLTGISGLFDLALDMGCFYSLGDNKANYLSELDRVLAPGGHWLMYGFFKSDSASNASGLAEADLDLIPASINLISRQDGIDKRERPSAWFLFQKSK